eukprot:CAMPEP_0197039026 /NCGR_PEP_ID=MMETSP1384-20130603/15893_1 /TAXON_ID=29189 /ORGANISM="Ammonia sp." /LENGTH=575 /DNA_ID=CAMNT_0042469563 /DNA_START=28 /DNA_END=1756 /DNA_ORIENTATION=-
MTKSSSVRLLSAKSPDSALGPRKNDETSVSTSQSSAIRTWMRSVRHCASRLLDEYNLNRCMASCSAVNLFTVVFVTGAALIFFYIAPQSITNKAFFISPKTNSTASIDNVAVHELEINRKIAMIESNLQNTLNKQLKQMNDQIGNLKTSVFDQLFQIERNMEDSHQQHNIFNDANQKFLDELKREISILKQSIASKQDVGHEKIYNAESEISSQTELISDELSKLQLKIEQTQSIFQQIVSNMKLQQTDQNERLGASVDALQSEIASIKQWMQDISHQNNQAVAAKQPDTAFTDLSKIELKLDQTTELFHDYIAQTKEQQTSAHHALETAIRDLQTEMFSIKQQMVDISQRTQPQTEPEEMNQDIHDNAGASKEDLELVTSTMKELETEIGALKKSIYEMKRISDEPREQMEKHANAAENEAWPELVERADFTVWVLYHTEVMTSSLGERWWKKFYYFMTRKYDQNAIRPVLRSGDCTPLKFANDSKQNSRGSSYIIFKLRQSIYIEGITVEYIDPALLQNDIQSAPKNMTLEFSDDGYLYYLCKDCGDLVYEPHTHGAVKYFKFDQVTLEDTNM